MRIQIMVLGISSGGIEGACQTGFRDLEGPSTTQLKSQPYLAAIPTLALLCSGAGVRPAAGCASAASSRSACCEERPKRREVGYTLRTHIRRPPHAYARARVAAVSRRLITSLPNRALPAQGLPRLCGPAAQNMNDLSNRRFQETVRTERPRPASRLKMHRLCTPADLRDRLF
jgi:hypothetical protein